MNVQSIWAGEEYAFSEYKGNKNFPMNAKKGKAIKITKEYGYGKERATAYVLFEVENGNGMTDERKIRARDVIDFWEDYVRERNALREKQEDERKEREARWAAQELERTRLREERERELERQRQEAREKDERLLSTFRNRTNIPAHVIVSVKVDGIVLDRTALELWLSIPNGG